MYFHGKGKRVIEQTLNMTVRRCSHATEYLFHKGLFDPIVERNLLKDQKKKRYPIHTYYNVKHKK